MPKMSHAFGPEKRVKKRAEFLIIQSSGKKFKTKNFLFILKKNEVSRLGITVTTKVDKRAVVRNQLKRRIREIYRRFYAYLVEPADVVIVAYQDAPNLDYLAVKKEINYAFRKLGLLENKNS